MLWFLILQLAIGDGVYPDPKLTPGAADRHVRQGNIQQTICQPGYTATVRHVTLRTRKQVFASYGIPYENHADYELDHLISLELGGTNAVANLWPQHYFPRPGAREKDVVENSLHSRV